MGRMGSMPRRLGLQPSRLPVPVTSEGGRSVWRDQNVPWRRWYKTSRWQRLRWSVLVRDLFTCRWPSCGKTVSDTSKLIADHIIPHRGDETLFWDAANLQCLCKACHDSLKQRSEAAGR